MCVNLLNDVARFLAWIILKEISTVNWNLSISKGNGEDLDPFISHVLCLSPYYIFSDSLSLSVLSLHYPSLSLSLSLLKLATGAKLGRFAWSSSWGVWVMVLRTGGGD